MNSSADFHHSDQIKLVSFGVYIIIKLYIMDLKMKVDLIRCYYANGNSPTNAIRQLKRERNLIRDPCTCSAVSKLISKFEETGSVLNQHHGRSSLEEERQEAVEAAVRDAEGKTSVRRLSNETGIPAASVHRILKHINMRPFKLQLLHDLQPGDFDQRVEFGQWFLRNQDLLPNIFWSDEAYFHLDGAISRYHCRIWSEERPKEFLTKPLHPEKLCVWIGFSASFIIEPFFFDRTVNSANYLEMLQNHVRPELGRRRKIRSTIFMQDGAPAHYATEVRRYLEATFGADHIISRGCERNWPSRSPDLTPVDYWFWGTLKARIFHYQRPRSLEHLRQRIQEECSRVTVEELRNAIASFPRRVNLMLHANGGHFEDAL